MKITRRDLLKGAGGLAGLAAMGKLAGVPVLSGDESPVPSVPAENKEADGFGTAADPKNKFGMVIDVGACIGCRRCMWACQQENNISSTISPFWIEVFQMESRLGLGGHASMEELKKGATTSYTISPQEGKWYLPVGCYHCDNPPCVKVCPTGATYKDKDGLVLMDYGRCIGCRLCIVACPYSSRRFNWWQGSVPQEQVNPLVPLRPMGVVEKCTFCVHRVRRGQLPRCVEVCPVGARHFGNINDPDSEVSRIVASNLGYQLLSELNTGPNIRYITRGTKWMRS